MSAVRKSRISKTAQVLAEMLVEDVGRSMLDSGGTPKYDEHGNYIGSLYGYGRSFERNKGRAFEHEPATFLSFRWGVEITHNVYHWLNDRLVYDGAMDYRFRRFANREEHEGKHWLQLMEEFPEYLRSKGVEVSGPGGGGDEPMTTNTYNNEDLLSQTLQFTQFSAYPDGDYVLLQIHGGADVRGGYTAPRAFRVLGDWYSMHDYGDAVVTCDGIERATAEQMTLPSIHVDRRTEPHIWDFQGGYWTNDQGQHWRRDDNIPFDKYQIKRADVDDDEEQLTPGQGYIYVDENGVGHCPLDGSPLVASWT